MFHVGDEFETYADLEEKIFEFERTEFVQVNVQRSRSVRSARKRTPSKAYSEDLEYAEIDLVCVHGGKHFKTASKGERPNQK